MELSSHSTVISGWLPVWHLASIRTQALNGRFRGIGDIGRHWRRMGRSQITQSRYSTVAAFACGCVAGHPTRGFPDSRSTASRTRFAIGTDVVRTFAPNRQPTVFVRAVTEFARRPYEPVIDIHVMARTRRCAPGSYFSSSTEEPRSAAATFISGD
jgi:hypothetical protein